MGGKLGGPSAGPSHGALFRLFRVEICWPPQNALTFVGKQKLLCGDNYTADEVRSEV